MNKFSCRLEFTEDFTRFIVAASKCNLLISISELHHGQLEGHAYPLPDVDVEFICDTDIETIRSIMRTVDDLHVAIQSLRQVPLKENSLVRDHDIR